MKKLYYKIMVSSIYTAQNNGIMSDIWKFTSSFYFAFALSGYLTFIYLLINNIVTNHSLNFLLLNLINKKHDFFLNMIIYFYLPIMIINYFVFFKDDKYKKLIKDYKFSYSKKWFAWYFMIALVFMFATLFLKK
jgi:hypothetical protein